jgi:hypothetical protein
MCGEDTADARYYRLNSLTEQIDHLCRPCWLTLRKSERSDWEYFKGASKLIFYYTILPVVITALLVWILVAWII